VVPQAIAVHAAQLAGCRGRRRATAPLVGSRFLATWREGGAQEKSGGMLIIRPLIDPRPQRGLRGRTSARGGAPRGRERGTPPGAQDAEKCSNLLTPSFAHGHEISFGIKYLCATAVKSSQNQQKNGANVSIGPAAICGSQRGAHLRRFPKHRFLVKCLAISVDHRPDRLARRFRVGMH